jgi:hypothetical protein
MLNEDCKQSIHMQSYEKCIPRIFQIMYHECNRLYLILSNHYKIDYESNKK